MDRIKKVDTNQMTDWCSPDGAQELANRIRQYWYRKGYQKIQVHIVPSRQGNDKQSQRWDLRANLNERGFPPR